MQVFNHSNMFDEESRQTYYYDCKKNFLTFSSNDTGRSPAEGPLYPDEKSETAKYMMMMEKKKEKLEHHCMGLSN